MKVFINLIFSFVCFLSICIAGCSKNDDQSIVDMNKKTNELIQSKDLQGALENSTRTIEKVEKEFGAGSIAIVKTLKIHGLIYQAMGDFHNAEKTYKDALSIINQFEAEKTADIVAIRNNMAGLYVARKEYDMAMEFYHEALKIAEANFASEDQRISQLKKNIEGCESLKSEMPSSDQPDTANKEIPDLVPEAIKADVIEKLSGQGINISNLRPLPPVRMDDQGMVFPYRCIQKLASENDEQDVVLLFAAQRNHAKEDAYVFNGCRMVLYESYIAESGSPESLKKAIIGIFPSIFS